MPRRVPPAAAGGKEFNRFLHGHVPGKKLFSPRECQLRWRGSGCIPQFWEPSAAGPKIPLVLLFYQRPHPAGLVPVLLGVVPEELPQAGVLGGLRPGQVGRHGRLLLAEPPAEGP